MIFRLVTYSTVFGLMWVASTKAGLQYSYADLKGYLDTLTNTSAMIFTIMGIWIAFLYPNALSRLVDPKHVASADFTSELKDTKRLEAIVFAVFQSGIAVLGSLMISLGKVLLGNIPYATAHMPEIKALVLSIVVTITVLQAEAVVHVLLSNLSFINDLHSKREEREVNNDA